MAGFLTQTQKDTYSAQMDRIHDTWARDVVVYSFPQRTIISVSSGYNFIYEDSQPAYSGVYTGTSGTYSMRVKYLTPKELKELEGSHYDLSKKTVRLKMTTGAWNVVSSGVENLEIDGERFNVFTNDRPHGLFTTQYITLICQEA